MRARGAALDGDRKAAIRLGDRCLPADGLQDNHSDSAKLTRLEVRAAPRRHDPGDSIASHWSVSIRQRLGASGIAMFACSQVIGASADRKRPSKDSLVVVLNPEHASVVSIRRKLNGNLGHDSTFLSLAFFVAISVPEGAGDSIGASRSKRRRFKNYFAFQ
jgi:hypothetical protein